MKATRKAILLCSLLCSLTALSAGQERNESPAKNAFKMLKTLEGKWKATTEQGAAAHLYYELVSSGTALHERFIDEGNKKHSNLITLYHLNNDKLEADHFCSMNNRPSLRASLERSKPNQILFEAYSVSNLASPDAAHMYKVIYDFVDEMKMTTIWTMRKGGKDVFVETLHWERETAE